MNHHRFFVAAAFLLAAGASPAANVVTLYNFNPRVAGVNSDGATPGRGKLLLSGNFFYGAAQDGGTHGQGTVFKIGTDGTGFTTLHHFDGPTDGYWPLQSLMLSGNQLYGAAYQGGSGGNGVLFSLDTGGGGFSVLHSTSYLEGSALDGEPVMSGNTIYQAAYGGGAYGYGSVFKVNTDGNGFAVLRSFSVGTEANGPAGGLVISGNILYGTTWYGGNGGNWGTVFAMNTDGTGLTTLHSFNHTDGTDPEGCLLLSGTTLYGTTSDGGAGNAGVVFKINTDGNGYTVLHDFSAPVSGVNSDGAHPWSQLTLSGDVLYGTTFQGGSAGNGTVFQLNTDGTGFTTLHSFSPLVSGANSDGAGPIGGVLLSGGRLYGTTQNGGTGASGTIFYLDPADPGSNECLTIHCPGNLVLSTCSNSLAVSYTVNVTDICCSNCVTLICDPPSGTNFQLGTTTVTCTATDSLGNSNNCSFTVTVNQVTNPPVITHCPAWVVVCTGTNGCGSMPDATGQVLAYENGVLLPVIQSIPAGTDLCSGTNLTFTVTNGCGQATNCVVPVVLTNCCCTSLLQRPWGSALTNIAVWELTDTWTRHDFSVVPFDPKLLKLSGTLLANNNDFATDAGEYYDVFLSEPDGTPNTNGCCVTIDCALYQTALDYESGGNIGAVELDFADGTVMGASSIGSIQLGQGISDPALLASQGQATNALGLHSLDLVPAKTTYLGYSNLTITVCYEAPCVSALAISKSPAGDWFTFSWPTIFKFNYWQLQQTTNILDTNWMFIQAATNSPFNLSNSMAPQQYFRLMLRTN